MVMHVEVFLLSFSCLISFQVEMFYKRLFNNYYSIQLTGFCCFYALVFSLYSVSVTVSSLHLLPLLPRVLFVVLLVYDIPILTNTGIDICCYMSLLILPRVHSWSTIISIKFVFIPQHIWSNL